MSLGFIGSAAGSPLAQTKGSEISRAQQDAASHDRKTDSIQHADDAAGIGQTAEDQEASDRDADGRRIWELGPDGKRRRKSAPDKDASDSPRPSKDPTGQSGRQLDLTG